MIPGEMFIQDGDIELNAGRKTATVTVANTGDRPIQVGSHYHFFETNAALAFDRKKARGMRLDIAAGTAVRFEPGQTRDVTLVALAGKRTVYGFRGDVMGKTVECAMERIERPPKAITGGPSSTRHKLSDPFPAPTGVSPSASYPVTESQGRQTWTTNTASSTHVPCPLRSWRPSVSSVSRRWLTCR